MGTKVPTLEERYREDPDLLQFYKRNLLVPGWAGELDKEELAYVKEKLFRDRRLRAKWSFKRGTGRLSDEKIRHVAMSGVDDLQNMSYSASEGSVQLRFDDDIESI